MIRIDKDQVLKLIAEFQSASSGAGVYETLTAISCVITDVLSSSAKNPNEAMNLFQALISSVGMDMQKRVDDGQCGWQNTKQ